MVRFYLNIYRKKWFKSMLGESSRGY